MFLDESAILPSTSTKNVEERVLQAENQISFRPKHFQEQQSDHLIVHEELNEQEE